MNVLRRRINPETFVITRKQLAKYLKTDSSRVWRIEKWKHVLWVHIQGIGGYFTTLSPARAMGSRLLHLNSCLQRLESTEPSLVSHPARSDKVHRGSLQPPFGDSRTTTCVFASSLTEITILQML
jgi:hypothetical protein